MLTLPYKIITQLLKGQTVIVSRPRLPSDVLQLIDRPNVRDRKYDHNGKARVNKQAIFPCKQVFSTTANRARFIQWRRYGARPSLKIRNGETANCMFVITDIQDMGSDWWLTLQLHKPE